jgi:transcription initiation factor IIE alpha subunit
MNDFYFYARLNGVNWYKCRICQVPVRGSIPKGFICPVCNGKIKAEDSSTAKSAKTTADFTKPV